jgi:hypothetical protein
LPAPDRMLIHLRQAIALVRATPGRRGHTLQLPDCTEVLIAGDLHGHVSNLQVMLRDADLASHPRRHLILQELIHGRFRYPKGGDKSHQLVDLFAALKNQFPRQVHFIPGNHELAQWTNRPVIKADENLNALFQEGVTEAYGNEYGPRIYAAYLELFQALPVLVRTPNRVIISHSIPGNAASPGFNPAHIEADNYEPADLQPGGTIHALLWGRDKSAATAAAFLEKLDADHLVSGHIACETGFDVPNERQIIIDCAECPAGYLLIPTDRPLTHQELVGCLKLIS